MSNLIKSDLVGRSHASAVYLIDCEAEIRARCLAPDSALSPQEQSIRIVAQAEAQASAIVDAARSEAESIRAAAREEGYSAGQAEWDARKQALEERMSRLETEVQQQVEESWSALESEVLDLSIDVAKQIVRHEIDQRQDHIVNTVKTALYQLRDRREIKLHLNSADFEFLKDHKEDIRGSFDGLQSMEMIEDRRIEKGGVLIESPSGFLDARLESQFAEAERTLKETENDG